VAGDEQTLTHFNTDGDVHMVDVGTKTATRRRAVAEGSIRMQPPTLAMIAEGNHRKGDVLAVARVAEGRRRPVPMIAPAARELPESQAGVYSLAGPDPGRKGH